MVKIGNYSFTFHNTYLKDAYTISGPLEYYGPIGDYINMGLETNRCKQKSWEKAEMYMINECMKKIIDNNLNEKIELAILGDLNNQIIASNYTMRNYKIPFLGVYSACSTFTESVIIGATFVDSLEFDNVIVGASSHNSGSERQFRSPTEYGGQKKLTSTYTVTGAGLGLLSNKKSKIKVTKGTFGAVYDAKIKDASDLGTAMAPAAALTFINHMNDFNILPEEYDLILTGDLSNYGSKIFLDILKEHKFELKNNYNDCGLLIYDIYNQDVLAGGSGAAASALVSLSYVKSLLEKGLIHNVLIIATGALFNPNMILQKETIPCIAHAIVLEGDE